jgi:hypothetical protein
MDKSELIAHCVIIVLVGVMLVAVYTASVVGP